ncbi:MAG: hypothetical protein ACFFCI_14070 [Promethearchaeota archaeon]
MENELNGLPSEYDEMINKLSSQIEELFSEIHYYQALVTEKENQIIRLTTENNQLRMKIRSLNEQLSPTDFPSQKSYTPPPPNQPYSSSTTSGGFKSVMKRQCPQCGAMGFAIKEVDDKTNIISYVPRRIYAKKMVCTKCRYEF